MTKRLYYENSHLKEFQATVTACEKFEDFWRISLDRTAFFPEGGGQSGDSGFLNTVEIFDTREDKNGIWHYEMCIRDSLEIMFIRQTLQKRINGSFIYIYDLGNLLHKLIAISVLPPYTFQHNELQHSFFKLWVHTIPPRLPPHRFMLFSDIRLYQLLCIVKY